MSKEGSSFIGTYDLELKCINALKLNTIKVMLLNISAQCTQISRSFYNCKRVRKIAENNIVDHKGSAN